MNQHYNGSSVCDILSSNLQKNTLINVDIVVMKQNNISLISWEFFALQFETIDSNTLCKIIYSFVGQISKIIKPYKEWIKLLKYAMNIIWNQ